MKKMLVVLFAMISLVAFSQENVVKEFHFVQPDGSVKIGHQVFPTIDYEKGTVDNIYDPKTNMITKIIFDKEHSAICYVIMVKQARQRHY